MMIVCALHPLMSQCLLILLKLPAVQRCLTRNHTKMLCLQVQELITAAISYKCNVQTAVCLKSKVLEAYLMM